MEDNEVVSLDIRVEFYEHAAFIYWTDIIFSKIFRLKITEKLLKAMFSMLQV